MRAGIGITAVIPTYNRGRVIRRAIESALTQRYPPCEVLIIDDGSADDTQEILTSYGAHVRVIYQPNEGVSAARNRAILEARGVWIAYLDSDDYWQPDYLSRMASTISVTRGEAAVYFADTQVGGVGARPSLWSLCGFAIKGGGEWEIAHEAEGWVKGRFQPMMLQSSIISRAALAEVGGFPKELCTREDTFLFFRLALQYALCAVSCSGAVMGSDGEGRLTEIYDTQSSAFFGATITMYSKLLETAEERGSEMRQHFRSCLSTTYFGRGISLFKRGQYRCAAWNLLESCRMDPTAFAGDMANLLVRLGLRRMAMDYDVSSRPALRN